MTKQTATTMIRSGAIVLAIMMIHVSSTEQTLEGILDRIIQVAIAFAVIVIAHKDKKA